MSDSADLEYLTLSFLDSAGGPVGSGALCDWLRQNGNDISEATVGRFLRELDFRSLTERAGFKGRVLTEKGNATLAEARRERAMEHSSAELIRALQANALDEVVDVLVARRAMERETARLAAIHATDDDLQALDALLHRYEVSDQVPAIAETDFAFHVHLAEISHNRVLQAATRLIHAQAKSSAIPAPIHRKLKPDLARQHREIVDAIRAHDPARAEAAMVAHLDGVIEVVRRQKPEPTHKRIG